MATQPQSSRPKRQAATRGKALLDQVIADQLATSRDGSRATTSHKRSSHADLLPQQVKTKTTSTNKSKSKKPNIAQQSPATLEATPPTVPRYNTGLEWNYGTITASYVPPPPPPRKQKQNKGY
ncbi:hypothetical protein JCM5350_000131 [Sporobolomyces pararoseus]